MNVMLGIVNLQNISRRGIDFCCATRVLRIPVQGTSDCMPQRYFYVLLAHAVAVCISPERGNLVFLLAPTRRQILCFCLPRATTVVQKTIQSGSLCGDAPLYHALCSLVEYFRFVLVCEER